MTACDFLWITVEIASGLCLLIGGFARTPPRKTALTGAVGALVASFGYSGVTLKRYPLCRLGGTTGLRAVGRLSLQAGKLCPKGVKRYMQDEHPDRLRAPLERV